MLSKPGLLFATSSDVNMHQASYVDGTSDSLDESHSVMAELRNDSIENSLTGVLLEVETAEEELNAYPSTAEAMTDIVSEIFN